MSLFQGQYYRIVRQFDDSNMPIGELQADTHLNFFEPFE